MDFAQTRHVIAAERIDDGVIITFDNGQCALYSAMLLHEMFASAMEVSGLDEDQWPPQDGPSGL